MLRMATYTVMVYAPHYAADALGLWRKHGLQVELRHLPEFKIATGHTYLADAAFMMGAVGCVPVLGNLIPATYAKIRRAADEGDWMAARKFQDEAVVLDRIVRRWEPRSPERATSRAA